MEMSSSTSHSLAEWRFSAAQQQPTSSMFDSDCPMMVPQWTVLKGLLLNYDRRRGCKTSLKTRGFRDWRGKNRRKGFFSKLFVFPQKNTPKQKTLKDTGHVSCYFVTGSEQVRDCLGDMEDWYCHQCSGCQIPALAAAGGLADRTSAGPRGDTFGFHTGDASYS